eukprot:bmy_15963T0
MSNQGILANAIIAFFYQSKEDHGHYILKSKFYKELTKTNREENVKAGHFKCDKKRKILNHMILPHVKLRQDQACKQEQKSNSSDVGKKYAEKEHFYHTKFRNVVSLVASAS